MAGVGCGDVVYWVRGKAMLMRALLTAAAVVLLCSPRARAGELTVTMNDGRVTVVANNVPLRQILTEWSRVGQTTIVGAERLGGAPLTLQLENVPERQALDTLLRAASGYMAAPRPVPVANASLYDRILILPTSTAPASAGPAPRPTPAFIPGTNRPMPPDMSESDESSDLPADISDAQMRGEDPEDVGDGSMRPAEAQFDYANPQLMMQQRLRQQQQQQGGFGAATPGTILQPAQPTPNVFPGTAMPGGAPQAAPTATRPGEVVQPPPQPQFNPYGLPGGVQPGSVPATGVQPDRAKYLNPYQQMPSKPPEE
jgi:hypothetical protein